MAIPLSHRTAFCTLADEWMAACQAEPPEYDEQTPVLVVATRHEQCLFELIHPIGAETFLLRAHLSEDQAPARATVLKALRLNFGLACCHLPLIAISPKGDGFIYTLQQRLDEAKASELLITVRHLVGLAATIAQPAPAEAVEG